MYSWIDIEDFVGKTFAKIEVRDESITFTANDGFQALMYHEQSCCESVYVDDIVGDIQALVGNKIVLAEEVSNDEDRKEEWDESYTWTFYKLADDQGHYVTIKWYGTSNGYYSESVDIRQFRIA